MQQPEINNFGPAKFIMTKFMKNQMLYYDLNTDAGTCYLFRKKSQKRRNSGMISEYYECVCCFTANSYDGYPAARVTVIDGVMVTDPAMRHAPHCTPMLKAEVERLKLDRETREWCRAHGIKPVMYYKVKNDIPDDTQTSQEQTPETGSELSGSENPLDSHRPTMLPTTSIKTDSFSSRAQNKRCTKVNSSLSGGNSSVTSSDAGVAHAGHIPLGWQSPTSYLVFKHNGQAAVLEENGSGGEKNCGYNLQTHHGGIDNVDALLSGTFKATQQQYGLEDITQYISEQNGKNECGDRERATSLSSTSHCSPQSKLSRAGRLPALQKHFKESIELATRGEHNDSSDLVFADMMSNIFKEKDLETEELKKMLEQYKCRYRHALALVNDSEYKEKTMVLIENERLKRLNEELLQQLTQATDDIEQLKTKIEELEKVQE